MTSTIYHEEKNEKSIWHGVVDVAEKVSRIHLHETAKWYLGITLMAYVRTEEDENGGGVSDFLDTLPQSDLQAALIETRRTVKCFKLQKVADGCLLICGLAPKRYEKFGITSNDVKKYGRSSYFTLSDEKDDELYTLIGESFSDMTHVLKALHMEEKPAVRLVRG